MSWSCFTLSVCLHPKHPHSRPVGDLGLDAVELLLYDVHRPVGLSLLEGLADAGDDGEALLESGRDLLADLGVGLVEERAPLAVSEDDPGNLGVCKLVEAVVSGKGQTCITIRQGVVCQEWSA